MPKRSLHVAEEEGGGSNSRKSNSLFVSFSKRRKGLFSKAAKLCDLFDGTQVAVLVLSPSGNPYAFGHSSVDNVLHRYYLGQPTMPKTTYPLMITTTTTTTLSDKRRYQANQVETLKARVKRTQNRQVSNSASLRDFKAWIDKACESCKTVEELEFLKDKFLALLESVRSRLILRNSSSSSSYGERKMFQTNTTLVGPAEDYVLDVPYYVGYEGNYADNIQSIGLPAGAVGPDPLSATGLQNDLPYMLETFGHSLQQGKVPVDETSTYGGGTVVELLDNYDFNDKCLITSATGFDHGNKGFDQCVGVEGNTTFFTGESSLAANVSCNVRPLVAIGPSNDTLFHSMEEFGYPDCDCYSEMRGVSYDQGFNYYDDQVPMLYAESFDRKI